MTVELTTFGGLHVAGPGGELDRLLSQHSRMALLVHLAIERRIARETVTAMFWPESDAENARHALRQSLYHLRKAIGDDWIDSGAHELTVRDNVRTDALVFTEALHAGDLEAALRLYRGPFLDGVYLVDLKPWETWVDARRAQYARAFRKGCRDLLDAKRMAGDLSGAIQAAEHWIERAPTDDEAQHRLIEALAAAGERTEAVRQYEAYLRRAEADGVQPLAETRELVERLRVESSPLPALRAVAIPDPPARPVSEAAPVAPEVVRPPLNLRARHPRRRSLLVGGSISIALLGAVWALRPTPEMRPPEPAPRAIAVLPFSVRGGDSLQYLSSGLVNLLGTAFDGAGSLRPVDARATFAAVRDAGSAIPDPNDAARIATRLRAEMFVLGDVVEAGGMLHLEAVVYHVGGRTPRSRAVVSGSADSVFSLVDRLAARLLGELGDPSADRLLRTAALTTSSLPALKAYLQGEELMRGAHFERAADAYLAAIALDSTFAVAYYRLSLAREWAPLPGNTDAASAAARHGERLSNRDRMLLDAYRLWRGGDGVQAMRAYQTILARYPDDVDAWFQLGEIQFHHGPLRGHPLGESEEAWRNVLAYEPRNLFAITHLARIAANDGRSSALDSLLAVFRQLEPEDPRNDRRLEELLILRAVATGDSAAALALAHELRRRESLAVWRVAVFLTSFSPDDALMRDVIQELIADLPDPGIRADLNWFVSVLNLSSGRLRAARTAVAKAAQSERLVPQQRRRRAYEPVTEWFAATLPLPYGDSLLDSVRRRALSGHRLSPGPGTVFTSVEVGASLQLEPLRQYTLGLLSLRLRDTAAAVHAAGELARQAAARDASALVRDLDRGLRARLAWATGRPEGALTLLDSLEYRELQGDITATPFAARANERFLRGEVLASMGRYAEALRWFASLGDGAASEIPLLAPSQLRQAEIHERLGNREQAERHYARFLTLWQDADPEFQVQVRAVRHRLRAAR